MHSTRLFVSKTVSENYISLKRHLWSNFYLQSAFQFFVCLFFWSNSSQQPCKVGQRFYPVCLPLSKSWVKEGTKRLSDFSRGCTQRCWQNVKCFCETSDGDFFPVVLILLPAPFQNFLGSLSQWIYTDSWDLLQTYWFRSGKQLLKTYS